MVSFEIDDLATSTCTTKPWPIGLTHLGAKGRARSGRKSASPAPVHNHIAGARSTLTIAVFHLAETFVSHLDGGAGCWDDLSQSNYKRKLIEALARLKQATE
jgi:hypothetical protein